VVETTFIPIFPEPIATLIQSESREQGEQIELTIDEPEMR
jgi:hypothetical protein